MPWCSPREKIACAAKPAHMPPVVPADRSISPSSSTKTRPIAMSAMYAPWPGRLPMLLRLRKRLLTWLKMTPRTTRPSTDGRAPGSPERSRPK